MEAPVPVALDFTAAGTMEVTHGLHAFAAKSPPALAQWAISAYSSRGDVVVDPMVGEKTIEDRFLDGINRANGATPVFRAGQKVCGPIGRN